MELAIQNQGKGLLLGTLTVDAGGEWLRPADAADGAAEVPIKTADAQTIVLRVETAALVPPQNCHAKLTLITNGGVVEVPVLMTLAAQPFPDGPLRGADSPRAAALRMQAQPKAAAPFLESGQLARWFATNGWTYPVAGPIAKGVGAVQQFFEGMGLSKPPPLRLSAPAVELSCLHPETVRGQVTLLTAARKWVYAQVESDVPWLRVVTPAVTGPQKATIDFEADSSLMEPGAVQVGTLQVAGNAGQRLALRVRVDVQRPHEPFTRRLFRPFLTGALAALAFRLLLAGPADLYARLLARWLAVAPDRGPAPGSPARWLLSLFVDVGPAPPWPAGSLASWLQSPLAGEGFVCHFVLATWWVGALAGVVLVRRRGRWVDVPCGLIAGATAGLAGSATFACLLPLLDALPRYLWHLLAAAVPGTELARAAWLWTPAWVLLAALCWTVMGAGLGFVLARAGRTGTRLLDGAAAALAWLFRAGGMRQLALYFA